MFWDSKTSLFSACVWLILRLVNAYIFWRLYLLVPATSGACVLLMPAFFGAGGVFSFIRFWAVNFLKIKNSVYMFFTYTILVN
jgi:hypothetical protein